MPKRIYVGNLPRAYSSQDLETLFAEHGTVKSAQVIMDRETGHRAASVSSRWNAGGTDAAMTRQRLHQGRRLTVNEARERPAGGVAAAVTAGGGGGRGLRRWRQRRRRLRWWWRRRVAHGGRQRRRLRWWWHVARAAWRWRGGRGGYGGGGSGAAAGGWCGAVVARLAA